MANDILNMPPQDRWITLIPSAAYTATPNSKQFPIADADGIVVILSATAVTATGSLTLKIEGVDPLSGATWTILTSAAVTAVGTTIYKVHPNLPAASGTWGSGVQDVVPPYVRVTVTHANGVSVTYSVSAVVTS